MMKLKSLILYIIFFPFCQAIGHAQIISTIAGTFGQSGYSGDNGQAIAAKLNNPFSISVDNAGNAYICDSYNSVIRRINTSAIITTIAGNGTIGYSGDGGPATSAQFHYMGCVTADNSGNLFVADHNNYVIRKISALGIISTIAGNGTFGFSGDGGLATSAQLSNPNDIAVDNTGNIYVADLSNARIRKISTAGIITTIAGNGVAGYSGDEGLATSAQITPTGLAVDNSGNIYIAGGDNRVRKVNTAGIITTVAGNGIQGNRGDGGFATSAQLNIPYDVAVDNAGNLYIADYHNHKIRKVNKAGVISTIAGTGTEGYSGDGGLAIAAQLTFPTSIVVDNSGSILIADPTNETVRKITTCAGTLNSSVTISASATSICSGDPVTFTANPANGGTIPFYQWEINGRNAGTNSPIFMTRELNNGDIISCVMSSSIPCTGPVLSANNFIITVKPRPDVNIMPDITIPLGSNVQINATANGTITRYQWTPAAGLNKVEILSPVATPDITTTYYLRAGSNNGCDGLDSVTITVFKKLFMPNAFTPNNDGRNDVFRIPAGTTFDLINFCVYNEWGSIIFKTKDINRGWDGKLKGIPCDTGTYVFTVSGKDQGKDVLVKGTLLLIR